MEAISRLASKALTATANLMGFVAVIALLFLICSATIDVAYRSVTGRSLFYGLLEYGEAALVVLAFLGAVRTQVAGGHVASTLVTSMMRVRAAAGLRCVTKFGVVLLLVWAAYSSGIAALKSYNSGEVRFGLVSVQMWPMRAVVPISLCLIALLLTREAWRLGSVALGAKQRPTDEDNEKLSI